ncbi:MAG: helix-turn-helix domain-containing protein [Clostridia bacterium]|nr:helix-turn-helix domain-containing protein [Clostridia bacterium]
MTFNEKLVKLRKLKGITQDEFASAVGVSRQAVYKWECGQSYPEAAKLIEIKAVFGISIDDLLDDNYEVVVPEKTKKKITPAKARAIENAVENEEKAEAALVAAKEESKTEETTASPAKEEPAAPATAPETSIAPDKEAQKTETKRGFFARLFGR